MRWSWLTQFSFLSAVDSQVTVIVVDSLLFRGVRRWVSARSRWLGQLLSCDLCFGTWVGFVLALIFRPGFVDVPPVRTASPAFNAWFQTLACFMADSFAIALGGRIFNELLGLMSREVAVREEEKELLAEELHHITSNT